MDLRFLDEIDWICCSPKPNLATVNLIRADEIKLVMAEGTQLPDTIFPARHHYLSPAAEGDTIPQRNIDWCVKLALENPVWRVSLQLHKTLGIR
jgi:organic radical activating enzyme